jgi:hypothetical protein
MKISKIFFSFFLSLNQYFPHIPYVASKKQNFVSKNHEKTRFFFDFLDFQAPGADISAPNFKNS